MKRQLWKAFFIWLGMVVGLALASSAQAQVERELYVKSYPNAQIKVDGNASDWNLAQFGTFVVGGMNTEPDHSQWERVTGTGDIARLGWDDANEKLFYAGVWTGAGLPADKVDNTVKFYARDNATHQYFLVDIADNEINTADEAAWANDSVEFYIDPKNDGDPTDWSSDVQLVIDAGNQVQVWNSPEGYEEQVEAGVESVVTVTATGWLLEVAIAKNAFSPPLPTFLGPANDPAGNNYGIDFSYRDNDDPDDTGIRNGDPAFSTDYVWADPSSGGGFPSKAASSWGEMIAGEPKVVSGDFNGNGALDAGDLDLLSQGQKDNNSTFDLNGDGATNVGDRTVWVDELKRTWMGDSDLNGEFSSGDFVAVFQAGKFETGQMAIWSQGDWNGDMKFDSSDFVLAFQAGGYERGPRPPAAAVPEPTSCALLLMAVLAAGSRRTSGRTTS